MNKDSSISAKALPEKLVLEFFERVWHKPHELDAIDELMTEEYVIFTAGKEVRGRENFKNWIGKFHQQLLEAKTESVEIFYNEKQDKVVSRWICSGKNNGLFGLAADHKAVSFTGIAIWTIKDDKLAECWAERSAHELYQSLVSGSNESDFV